MESKSTRIRVLVVDDNDLIRSSLAALLSYEPEIEVVGEACDGGEAIEKVKAWRPDVVLMDIQMPTMNGFEATSQLNRRYPDIRVLAVTHLEELHYFNQMITSGARGIVLKSCAVDELKQSIQTVYRGGNFFSQPVLEMMELGAPDKSSASVRKPTLTFREREVLKLVASGYNNQQVAENLQISIRSVEFHRANIIEKINAHDLVSLVRYAQEEKIIGTAE